MNRPVTPPAPLQRLFFALWPDAVLQRRLHSVADTVLMQAKDGRRTPVENVHLTLAFLGSVNAGCRVDLERKAGLIRVAPFELVLDRTGCFRRRSLFWAGPSKVPSQLLDLVNALKAAQSACGLVPEGRKYLAHITLIRDLKRCPPEMTVSSIVWPVDRFVLVHSRVTSSGSRYEVVASWRLDGPRTMD